MSSQMTGYEPFLLTLSAPQANRARMEPQTLHVVDTGFHLLLERCR